MPQDARRRPADRESKVRLIAVRGRTPPLGCNLMNEPVTIHSTDFWVKVVEMLQQNWALIEDEVAGAVRVYFISDTSGVFDETLSPPRVRRMKRLS